MNKRIRDVQGFVSVQEQEKRGDSKFPFRTAGFLKEEPRRRWIHILKDLNTKQLKDFNRYFQDGFYERAGKGALAKSLEKVMMEHLEYLLVLYTEEEVGLLLEILDAKNGDTICIDENNVDCLTALQMLGMADTRVLKRRGEFSVGISIPTEVQNNIIPYLRRQNWNDVWDAYAKAEKLLDKLIIRYGAVESHSLYERYKMSGGSELDYKMFMRVVYLRGTVQGKLKTATAVTDKLIYVFLPELDLESTYVNQNRLCGDMDYPDTTENELDQIIEADRVRMFRLYHMAQSSNIGEEDARTLVQTLLAQILHGGGIRMMMETAAKTIDMDIPVFRTECWMRCMEASLFLHIGMLKGYSRSECHWDFGKELCVNMFPETDVIELRQETIKGDTPLHLTPVDHQIRLAGIICLMGKGQIQQAEEQIEELRESTVWNLDTDILFINLYIEYDKLEKARQLLQQLRGKEIDPSTRRWLNQMLRLLATHIKGKGRKRKR